MHFTILAHRVATGVANEVSLKETTAAFPTPSLISLKRGGFCPLEYQKINRRIAAFNGGKGMAVLAETRGSVGSVGATEIAHGQPASKFDPVWVMN